MTERLRPPTGPSVGSGSASVEARPEHAGRTRDRDEGTVAVDELLTQSGKCGALLGDRCSEGGEAAEVVGEGQVDDPVSAGGAGAERAQIGEVAANGLGSGGLEGRRGGVGAGEGEDGVAVAE